MRFIQFYGLFLAVLQMIFVLPVQAAEWDGIYQNNQAISAQWVNWCPESWERSDEVQSLSTQLAAEAGSREALPRHIYQWVCTNISYDWEALEKEIYRALLPSQVLRERQAVCEGVANLTQALFLEADIPCIKVWGAALTDGMSWTDMNSSRVNHTWNEFYMNGRWITMDCTMDILSEYPASDDYFDPPEAFFAQTHKRLRRGDTTPENTPSAWAIPEITEAIDAGIVPLDWLTGYHNTVSGLEWFVLTGLGERQDVTLTRIAAAVSIVSRLEESASRIGPYTDTGDCSERETDAVALLWDLGIMVGWDGQFFPQKPLTRQEAIVIFKRLFRTGGTECT